MQTVKHIKHCLVFLCPQFQTNPEPDLEIVVCSGFGKNGGLSVLQVNTLLSLVNTLLSLVNTLLSLSFVFLCKCMLVDALF